MKRLAGENGWMRIERARLRAPGNRAADTMQWITRAGVALAVGAALWLAFAAFNPMSSAERVEGPPPPPIPSFESPPVEREDRREVFARLGGVNLFDAEREAWSARPRERTADGEAMPGETKPAPPPAAGTQATSIGGQSVLVTKAESLPEDVKAALTGLALRGIYVPPRATEPVAMISRVHGGPNPMLSDVFRSGDEFEDKQHPQAKWRLIAIDQPGRRVILQRGGINAVLSLYASAASPSIASSSSPEASTEAKKLGATIVVQTKEEIESSLREAKVSEEEVKRLLELAAMSPEEAAASAKIAALAKAAKDQAKDQKPGRRAPPPGLEAIAKLLQQPPKPPPDVEPPAESPPAEPEKKPE